MKTLFIDIDGTLLYFYPITTDSPYPYVNQTGKDPIILPGVHKRLEEWREKGYFLVLVTSRPNSARELTIKQLNECSIPYDMLICGLPHSDRVLINDKKNNNSNSTCFAVNIDRNEGLTNIIL